MYYLDTSAWLKRYYDELGSEWVQHLFRDDALFACATLGLVEVYATLTRKQNAGQLEQNLFDTIVDQLERDWIKFTQVAFDDMVLDLAKRSARSFGLRGADAIHLGSALYLKKELVEHGEEIILVTADQELLTAASASGITVLDPTEKRTEKQESDVEPSI